MFRFITANKAEMKSIYYAAKEVEGNLFADVQIDHMSQLLGHLK